MSHYRLGRFLIVILSLVALPLSAAEKDWNDGSDNWSNPAAWTPAGVPAAGDDAIISFNDDVARTITYDYTGPDVVLNSLTVDLQGAVTNTITLSMAANSLTANIEFIGLNGSGTFNQSGGTNTAGSLRMG